jgi:4-hydroxy-tetrahydrodipicolinate reductase
MKVALVGYGKMGRMIEGLAAEYGIDVALVLDIGGNSGGAGLTAPNFSGVDAAIEFTTPEAAAENLVKLAALKVPTVTGTTGWLGRFEEVKAAFLASGGTLVWSANFSIGVNIFDRVVREAARWMERHAGYECWAWEIHHSQKKDAPSGTLLKLVDSMRAAGFTRKVDAASSRAGSIPGTHEIGFDSAADTITLRHTARSREGFARGALEAARWAAGGRAGVWEFGEILFSSAKE